MPINRQAAAAIRRMVDQESGDSIDKPADRAALLLRQELALKDAEEGVIMDGLMFFSSLAIALINEFKGDQGPRVLRAVLSAELPDHPSPATEESE